MNDPYLTTSLIYDGLIEPFLAPLRRRTLSVLQQHLPPDGHRRVLEIACGTGTLAGLIAGSGYTMVALDSSPAMIRRTQRKRRSGASTALHCLRADAARLPFAAGMFDAAVVQLALHEMDEAVRAAALTELVRVTVTDAIFCLLDFIPRPGFGLKKCALTIVERAAGKTHYTNGRRFLADGGLPGCLQRLNLKTLASHRFFGGNLCLAVARKEGAKDSELHRRSD
jgi:ubiquinone/menaquinone biosynthesis C-methylase UbiE